MAEWLMAQKLRVGVMCVAGMLSWIGSGHGALFPSQVAGGARTMPEAAFFSLRKVPLDASPFSQAPSRCPRVSSAKAQANSSKSLTRPPGTLSPGFNCSGAPEGPCGGGEF
jgi:hypothetical protein